MLDGGDSQQGVPGGDRWHGPSFRHTRLPSFRHTPNGKLWSTSAYCTSTILRPRHIGNKHLHSHWLTKQTRRLNYCSWCWTISASVFCLSGLIAVEQQERKRQQWILICCRCIPNSSRHHKNNGSSFHLKQKNSKCGTPSCFFLVGPSWSFEETRLL